MKSSKTLSLSPGSAALAPHEDPCEPFSCAVLQLWFVDASDCFPFKEGHLPLDSSKPIPVRG